jgi:hypothetical protein
MASSSFAFSRSAAALVAPLRRSPRAQKRRSPAVHDAPRLAGRRLHFDLVRHPVRINLKPQYSRDGGRHSSPFDGPHLQEAEGFELAERAQEIWLGAVGQSRELRHRLRLGVRMIRSRLRFSGVNNRSRAAVDSTLGRCASAGAAVSSRATARISASSAFRLLTFMIPSFSGRRSRHDGIVNPAIGDCRAATAHAARARSARWPRSVRAR